MDPWKCEHCEFCNYSGYRCIKCGRLRPGIVKRGLSRSLLRAVSFATLSLLWI